GDDRLVERARAGDEEAFEDLVRRYEKPIYYLALRFVKEEQAAADLAQTAFLKAYEGLRGFRGQASFKTWLYRIAMNLCKNYLRDQGKKKVESLGEMDPPSTANPLRELIEHESQALLARAWARLPEKQRMTVVLKVQEGMKYREIAEVMGCSVGTIKANFHHACTRLKAMLQEGRDEMP
ncbi:MAG TPA: sigma-70 family RNA polymerase sigma factor, partial [Thermodesulfobacteriota bacterium]